MGEDFSLFRVDRQEDPSSLPTRSHVPQVPPDLAVIALGEIPGVGHGTAVLLYDAGSFGSIFTANRDEVHWLAGSAKVPSPDHFSSTFIEQRDHALLRAFELKRQFEQNGVELVLDTDPRYPERLRVLADRPRWLFIRGNVDLLLSER